MSLNKKTLKLSVFFGIILLAAACQFQKQDPTYAGDIAPIIYRSCTPCHRPGQIGHFNLISYADVKASSEKILYTVKNRLMPPWPADPNYTHFIGEQVLTDEEINLIETWVKLNCPMGEAARIPKVPEFPMRSFLGNPDLSIPVKPIFLKGDYADRFLLIKVPYELPADTFLRAVEFVPGNTKVVHHVNGDMVRFDAGKKKNVYDGALVTDMVLDSTIGQAYKNIGVLHDDGSFPTLVKSIVNYLPGVIAQQYPDGIGGWRANQKNAFLLADLHYGPSVDDVWDSSFINIFYAKTPPKRPLQEFQMGTLGISPIVPPLVIPPGKVSTYTTRYTLPKSISILTINPHMHLLGKSFKAYALTPENDTIRLIHIPRWDFNWQNFYTFQKMIKIPAGSTIVVEGVFDNTENNPFNPNHPPKEVRDNNGSMRTTDEMFQFIVTYLPYEEGDEMISLERK
ncbi:MAG: hypothetical protein JNJ58_01320 [Chitinophagaceae bacterium]|nr:hypothetical protein [Chitinophagaceae bacterium]